MDCCDKPMKPKDASGRTESRNMIPWRLPFLRSADFMREVKSTEFEAGRWTKKKLSVCGSVADCPDPWTMNALVLNEAHVAAKRFPMRRAAQGAGSFVRL